MVEELLTFHSFSEEELAEEFGLALLAKNIPFEIEKIKPILDTTIAGEFSMPAYIIKLQPSDFERAHECLEDYYRSQVELISADHYLFEFTDNELIEILQKPDEWGYLDRFLAQRILNQRGYNYDTEKLKELRAKRNEELEKPEHQAGGNLLFIAWGCICIGIVVIIDPFTPLPFLWSFGGAVLGSFMTTLKKTVPNGKRVPYFEPAERKKWRIVMIVGWIVFAGCILRYMFIGI